MPFQLSDLLIKNNPITNSLIQRDTTLIIICLFDEPRRSSDLSEKIKLTPIINMNHGITKSATVNPCHRLCEKNQ